MSTSHDQRANPGRRTTPRGGHGNAEPTTRRRVLVDLREIARYNAGVFAARVAYAEHPDRTDGNQRHSCYGACGKTTSRACGYCVPCEEALT